MKKRKTRFNEGGLNPYRGDDVDPFSAVRNPDGGTEPMREGPSSEGFMDEGTGKELSTRRNLETGDYYSTEPITRKAETPRAAPKAAKAESASVRSSEVSRAPRAAERADFRKFEQEAERKVLEDRQKRLATPGSDKVEPDVDVISPFPGASKFLQAGARGLANILRGREFLAEAAKAGAKRIGEGQKMLESPGKIKQRGLNEERATRAARRDKEVSRGIRQKSDDSGAIRLAKGGSASSRADGCAARGKTRGKMY